MHSRCTSIVEPPNLGGLAQQEIGTDQCNQCLNSGGVCGYNRTTTQFTCFCQNQPWSSTCPRPGLWLFSSAFLVLQTNFIFETYRPMIILYAFLIVHITII
ncbi:hypothetical protein SLE2022_188860 [Rubroshorea leprosula]